MYNRMIICVYLTAEDRGGAAVQIVKPSQALGSWALLMNGIELK